MSAGPARDCPVRGRTSLIPAAVVTAARHTGRMDDEVVFMVRGKSRAICQQYVDRLCTLLGARQASLPSDGTGRGWVARAILRPLADTDESAAG